MKIKGISQIFSGRDLYKVSDADAQLGDIKSYKMDVEKCKKQVGALNLVRMKLICIWFLIYIISYNTVWSQNKTVNVTIDFQTVLSKSFYKSGVTHTQKSIDPWGNAASIKNAMSLLESAIYFQNQHIMGWGTLNPWPDSTVTNPDKWNWGSLDRRIDLIMETNGEPVITLCACPSWMHTPSQNGNTDWNSIEKAPTKNHYDDFAHLCAEVARRYPDVKFFQVWNEFKGFYNASKNRWDYEKYTQMYNMIYDSLKTFNKEIKVGGPYVVMDSWSSSSISHPSEIRKEYGVLDQRPLDVISYWLNNKHGADFITIDGGNRNKDDVWNTNGFRASQKFVDVINWIRQKPNSENLPVWWAEWYSFPENYERGNPVDLNLLDAYMAVGLIESIKAGYSTLLIWEPQGDASGFSYPLGIWTNTEIAGGGKPTPFYYTQKGLNDYFGEGEKLYKDSLSQNDVISVLATDTTVMLVNQLNETVDVTIKGYANQISLSSFEVKFIHYNDLSTTNIEKDIKTVECSMYPNPFTDHIYMELNSEIGKIIKIDIYDLLGTKCQSGEFWNNNRRIKINTEPLANGSYLIRARGEKFNYNKIIVKK